MKVFTKSWTIVLPISLETAWHFFSRPENLQHITPAEMRFKIHSTMNDHEMYEGMIIHYTVRPLLGIPMRWTTEITHIDPHRYFIDEQRSGPYALWHHEHHFKAIAADQVEMRDLLSYGLPMGPFGELLNSTFISNKIDRIFDFRTTVLKSRFV